MKARPSDEEVKGMGPEFEKAWNQYFKDKPDKPLIFIGVMSTYSRNSQTSLVLPEIHLSFQKDDGSVSRIPLLEGIYITSKDVYSTPDFDAGFLSHPADLPPQVWAFKRVREIVRRMPCFRSELAPSIPKFPIGSKAASIDIPVEFSPKIAPEKSVTARNRAWRRWWRKRNGRRRSKWR